MLIMILQHTPIWVFALLALVLRLGFNQTRPRTVTLQRATVLPLVMLGLSVVGIANGFGTATAFAAWAGSLLAVVSLASFVLPQRQAQYDPLRRLFTLPGSWLPLGLIIAVFSIKYAVGATLAMHPTLHGDIRFVVVVSLLYGLTSGIFLARALQLWQIARRHHLVSPA
ncbi:MAG: hypothetical protein JO142_04900 [Burkholderiales bacterium]|nr:hypothetical protein [Burkholderiales bacterium]